jgi:ketosteroid isomerase-like protein
MRDASPAAAVEAANRRFYEVFERMRLPEMEALWSHRADVACIHPGWRILEGWEAVRESWAAIFEGGGEMRFSIGDARVRVDGDLGWVTCTESILSEAEGGDWLMVHHHASHVLAPAGTGA